MASVSENASYRQYHLHDSIPFMFVLYPRIRRVPWMSTIAVCRQAGTQQIKDARSKGWPVRQGLLSSEVLFVYSCQVFMFNE